MARSRAEQPRLQQDLRVSGDTHALKAADSYLNYIDHLQACHSTNCLLHSPPQHWQLTAITSN